MQSVAKQHIHLLNVPCESKINIFKPIFTAKFKNIYQIERSHRAKRNMIDKNILKKRIDLNKITFCSRPAPIV